MSEADLKQWFASQQKRMVADMDSVRSTQSHPTARGDGSEENWLTMFQRQLPGRYQAEKAFVIDYEGNRSQQLDIVIHDRQYSPLPLDVKGGIHIPAESVYAVLEVKQSLNAENLKYAGEKVASVRRLNRTAAHFAHAQGNSRTPPKKILGGILAFDSDWSPALGDSLLTAISRPPPLEQLDLGCALKHGVFEVTWKPDGTPDVDRSGTGYALVYFFFRLLKRLQQFGTVSAMDYDLWTRCLKS